MKIAHKNKFGITAKGYRENLNAGAEFEKSDNIDAAIVCYENCIKVKPLEEAPYLRLMIIYRKQKAYKKELAVIQRGLKAFEDRDMKRIKGANKNITTISNSLLKVMGYVVRKNKPVYESDTILKWKKRAALVQSRIAKL